MRARARARLHSRGTIKPDVMVLSCCRDVRVRVRALRLLRVLAEYAGGREKEIS